MKDAISKASLQAGSRWMGRLRTWYHEVQLGIYRSCSEPLAIRRAYDCSEGDGSVIGMKPSNVEFLRKLRAWHYAQALSYRGRAEAVGQLDQQAGERTASVFHHRSNEHRRFVEQLNEFFPETDRVM